ncbi:hypothetical protein DTL42_18935 [Bremerella cremea]|uniref:Uncharacterized protein n=1 Tax=Bremerella cremea TaxID=1031537 RepID=A0A368KPZ0_9BACT|nr:hypothetical protein [Bremerella cremea]RCS43234.1 hypothetical protein DTL42_18935 [Bremerella cremea]
MFWKKPHKRPECRCNCGAIEKLVHDRRSPLRYCVDQAAYYLRTANSQFLVNCCPMCGSPVRFAWTPLELTEQQQAILKQLQQEVTTADDIEPKLGPPDAVGELVRETDKARELPGGTVVCQRTWTYRRAVPFATICINELNDGSLSWIYTSI